MESPKPLLREYLEAFLIAVIFATFARAYLVQAFKIPSGSMEENLLIGDHLLVNKFVYGPAGPLERALLPQREIRRGDVVVFKFPEDPARDFIKRCVGLPGDSIEISDKVLFLNGREVRDGSYVYNTDEQIFPRSLPSSYRNRDNYGPFTVPPEHYFCLGDNRDESNDSRFWGPVPASYVRGRALLIYWSLEHDRVETAAGSSRLRQVWRDILRIPAATRWERTFRLVR